LDRALSVGTLGGAHFRAAHVNSLLVPHTPNEDVLLQADTHRIATSGPIFGTSNIIRIGLNYKL
jgi:hypothetical protein